MPRVDIRQAKEFASFMENLGWSTDRIGTSYVYRRKFPFMGNFAKIPRASSTISLSEVKNYISGNRVFQFKISPFLRTDEKEYLRLKKKIETIGLSIENSPFNPTTTIQISLKKSPEDIFHSFSEAKRRGVRRAIKHGITVCESEDISSFIAIRQHQYKPMGFLITKEMKLLWKHMHPKKASLLLAFTDEKKPVAGILLLFHQKISSYWFASALAEGKKLFAPSLLVWEAIKTSQKKGCDVFDFEGIYDDRFPKASSSWKGFTKFKEGFGGKTIVFMENFTK